MSDYVGNLGPIFVKFYAGDLHPLAVARASLQRAAGEFLWVGLGQLVSAIGLLVGVRVLTGYLSPTQYGLLSLAMTLAILFQQALIGPLVGAFLRYFSSAQESLDLNSYLSAVKRLLFWATRLLATVCIPATAVVVILNRTWVGIAIAIGVLSLLLGLEATLDSMQNAIRQRRIVAWHDALGPWLRVAIAVFLIGLLSPTAEVALAAYCLAATIVLGSQVMFFRQRILVLTKGHSDEEDGSIDRWVARFRSYSWPIATWGLFTWIQLSSDRWALAHFRDAHEVGLYSAAYQIGYFPIILVSNALLQLLGPVLFNWAGDAKDPARVTRAAKMNRNIAIATVIVSLAAAALAALLHPAAFRLLVSPQYASVSGVTPFLLLSGGLFAAGQIAAQSFMVTLTTRALIRPKIVTAALGSCLNAAGAYLFGLEGVVGGTLITSTIYFTWMLRGPKMNALELPLATGP